MINTLHDIVAEVTNRIGITTNSTFFTSTKINSVCVDAYNWSVALYQWPMLETAKKTTTQVNQYYYDYPEGFMTDSVARVIVDGDLYELKNFDDFLNYKYETAVTTVSGKKIAADYGKQIFIYPTPTVANLDIMIWGLEMPDELTENEDTIFTDSDIMGNEAVVKKALSVLLAQANRKQEGQAEEAEAIAMLANLYSKILKRQAKYQRLDKQMFNVPDFFGNNNEEVEDNIGNF